VRPTKSHVITSYGGRFGGPQAIQTSESLLSLSHHATGAQSCAGSGNPSRPLFYRVGVPICAQASAVKLNSFFAYTWIFQIPDDQLEQGSRCPICAGREPAGPLLIQSLFKQTFDGLSILQLKERYRVRALLLRFFQKGFV
jgi:hypothetical protein